MELSGTVSGKASSLRFWYGASTTEFLDADPNAVLGELTANCDFALIPTQRDAWLAQIEFLRSQLHGLAGSVFFEFNIPRMGRRIDVVLVTGPLVFAIEFKVGEKAFDRSAIDQVWDYGLDLKNFHEASHDDDRAENGIDPSRRWWIRQSRIFTKQRFAQFASLLIAVVQNIFCLRRMDEQRKARAIRLLREGNGS